MLLPSSETLFLAACMGEVHTGSSEDWTAAVELAREHGLGPLVFSALRYSGSPGNVAAVSLPDAAWISLEQEYEEAVKRHGRACLQLISVLESLAGIRYLVLKGPALSTRLYPRGGRTYGDLDIVVQESDYSAARAALRSIGYNPPGPHVERYQRLVGRDLSLIPQDERASSMSVELHWRMSGPAAGMLDEVSIWKRSQQVTINDWLVDVPGPEDTLLLLALNLRLHRFARLKTLCDIGRLLRQEGRMMDWTLVHAEAHEAGLCITLRHALDLAHAAFGNLDSPMPYCGRQISLQRHLLSVAASPTRLLNGRHNFSQRAIGYLLPFLSLDQTWEVAALIRHHLALIPEYARYRLDHSQ